MLHAAYCVPELDISKQNCLAEVDTILKRGWSEDFKMVRVEILGLRPWKWRRVENAKINDSFQRLYDAS